MSMTTEQALQYMHSNTTAEDSKVSSTEEPKAEESTSNSPEQAATDGEQNVQTTEESDESKVESTTVEDNKSNDQDHHSHKEQRDYAFIREKNKRKAQAAKYQAEIATKDARIKELEDKLTRYRGLTSDNFKKDDGSTNYDAYTNWKLQERDMQNEVQALKSQIESQSRDRDIELDRIATERCFSGKDLEEYDNLIATKGAAFADAMHEFDDTNTMFKYLDTVQDYPVVLKEFMTNPNKWLPRICRSKDPESIRYNTARAVDQILDEYANHSTLNTESAKTVSKPQIPVTGKQITNAGATQPDTSKSLLTSINSINDYLSKHKRR